MIKIARVVALCLFVPCMAQAEMFAMLQSGPIPLGGGQYAFNYVLVLPGNERLDPTATNGVTCRGASSTVVLCNPTGTFVTIYDIPGFVSSGATAAGWSATNQFVGVTPSQINASSLDSANAVNVTFAYTGPVVHAGSVDVTFSGFRITSTLNGINATGHYSSQDTQDVSSSAGLTAQGVGSVQIPTAPTD
ncbi:MAG: hypothetical protein ACHQQS_04875 [Thermoanaerobaculales bacterium]